jgi:VWFA-related protein
MGVPAPRMNPMVEQSWRSLRAATVLAAAVISGVGLLAGDQQQPPPGQPPATPPPTTQTQPPADQRPPTFRTGADVVRVDVTVIDRKGVPLSTLTAEDFEVTEDDVPQTIQSFKFVAVTGHPDDSDETSLPIRSQSHAAAEAARDDVRVFLIFWDEYHIGRFQPALQAREYLTKFVHEAFAPKDIVAFMDPLTPTDALKFTRDRLELVETVRKLRGRLGEYMPARSVIEESHLYHPGDIERLRSEVSISALKAAAVYLGSIRQGRKAVVLISQGMRGLRRDDERNLFQDLFRAANDSNTAFYSINPLGMSVNRMRFSPFDMLESLSIETGGEFFNTNDYRRALDRVVTQSSAFYLIGYAPQQRFDGKFHKIKVKVKKPGLEVRARSGYWAPTVADMTRAEKVAAEAVLPPAVESALSELPPPVSRRTIDLWVGTGVSESGRAEVSMAWEPREATPDQKMTGTAASVSVVATGESGQAFEGEVDADGVSFEAPPGKLELTITARDKGGEIIDRDKRTIIVPDPAAAKLWIGSPVVISTTGPIEWRALKDNPSPVPSATREFTRGERLLIRFEVYGANSKSATVSARLKTSRGAPLTTIRVDSNPAGGYEIDLPLATIARGEFLLSIEANYADERAEALVPLRVLR